MLEQHASLVVRPEVEGDTQAVTDHRRDLEVRVESRERIRSHRGHLVRSTTQIELLYALEV